MHISFTMVASILRCVRLSAVSVAVMHVFSGLDRGHALAHCDTCLHQGLDSIGRQLMAWAVQHEGKAYQHG